MFYLIIMRVELNFKNKLYSLFGYSQWKMFVKQIDYENLNTNCSKTKK